jgi:hypothetical protein
MLVARKDTTTRVPVVLLNSSGAPVTGIGFGQLNDTTGVNKVSVIKSDGSVSSLTLDGTTWTQISATRAPGLYHITVPSGSLNLVGGLQIAVRANASEFETALVSISVEEYHIASKVAKNTWQIHTSGGDANRLVIYDDDGTTPLLKFDLTDSTAAPTTSAPFKRTKI